MEPEIKKHANKCAKFGYIQEEKVKEPDCTCDGYHTFDELYHHRISVFIALCKKIYKLEKFITDEQKLGMISYPTTFIWRSKLHSDGSKYDGWFILGINKEQGFQITYHLPIERWDDTYFANTLDKAPVFDGHTSDDVIRRINSL